MINMNEETFYEGGPAKSDLIINLLAGITILGLPFTFAAIVRALWLRYKITNKRITIEGGWFGKNKTQVSLSTLRKLDLFQGDSVHMVTWFLSLTMDQRLR